jgi:hypothetical protein
MWLSGIGIGAHRRACPRNGPAAQNTLSLPVPDEPMTVQAPEHGWEVKTFDGQRLVGTGTFVDEAVARLIAKAHRDLGFTTRVRPAGVYGQGECCDSCTDETWAGPGYSKGETS